MMLLELILVLLMITLALFIHEMGHALALIMSVNKAKAEVYVGSSSKEKKLRFRIGRITCYVNIAISGVCYSVVPEELPPTTSKQQAIFLVGGPIASILSFIALYLVSTLISGVIGAIITGIAFICLITFIMTLMPITYPAFLGGLPSDGLQLLTIFKENRKQRKAVL